MIDKLVQNETLCLFAIYSGNVLLKKNSMSNPDRRRIYNFILVDYCQLPICLHSCIIQLSDVHVHRKRLQKVVWPFHLPQWQMRLKPLVVVQLL